MKKAAFEAAHNISKLTLYGTLMTDRKDNFELCMFPVDSIVEPCTAVPYKQSDTIITAKEWIILKPRSDWYSIMVEAAKEFVST